MPQRILALEVDSQTLKAAVVETTFRDFRVAGFFEEAVGGEGDGLAEHLRRLVAANSLEGATVLSTLPGDLVSVRTMFLPFRDRKRLDQTVPFELETQVPFGLDEIVVDYQVLQRDKAGSTVLAALVQRKDLDEHLGMLAAAGLDPKVVDVAPLATLNVLSLVGEELPGTYVYVGGSMRRLLVALFRNRRLVGVRTLVAGPPAAAAGNGHAAGTEDQVAALVGEVRWTLLALNEAPFDDGLPCLVAGEGSEFEALMRGLAGLDLDVRRLDAVPLRKVADAQRSAVPRFVTPLGLALREVEQGERLGLNFRQGEFAYHRGEDELRQALWRTASLGMIAVTLLLLSLFMSHQEMERRLASIQTQIRLVVQQTLPDVKLGRDERAQLQAEIDAAQKKLQVLSGIAPSGATAIDVLRTMAAAIPETLRIDVDEYVMDVDGVRLKARTDSFETADQIKQKLVGTRAFSDVQVKDIKQTADGSVDFRIVLNLGNKEDAAAAPAPPRQQ
ncbi:pilus assembly protein PilM [Candidatus Binatia bacterium]|nr:pilus assembly protein PilM [Candidatus Binatia bacterium]